MVNRNFLFDRFDGWYLMPNRKQKLLDQIEFRFESFPAAHLRPLGVCFRPGTDAACCGYSRVIPFFLIHINEPWQLSSFYPIWVMNPTNQKVILSKDYFAARMGEKMNNVIRIFAIGASLICLSVGQVQAAVVNYTSLAAFQAGSGPLTLVNFDVDSGGNPIAAPSPGILAGNNFSGYGITFNSGIVFGEPNLPFLGVSPPNIISNTGINTPTPALVNGVFSAPVFEVGLTNTGAESILRIFDSTDTLIASINSDLDPSVNDFIGLISDTPIYRMEFDFVSGIGFGGDDLYFTQIASPVPLPAAAWLFGTAIIGFVGYSRRRKIL